MTEAAEKLDKETFKNSVRLGRAIDQYEMKKFPLIIRSKYYVYNQPSIKVSNAQSASRRRIRLASKKFSDLTYNSNYELKLEVTKNFNDDSLTKDDRARHERLIGQLKAAESRNRVRMTRMRYLHNKDEDTAHLIQCQPTAIKAVRLEAFLSDDRGDNRNNERKDLLPPIERRRLEAILNDDIGLLFERLL